MHWKLVKYFILLHNRKATNLSRMSSLPGVVPASQDSSRCQPHAHSDKEHAIVKRNGGEYLLTLTAPVKAKDAITRFFIISDVFPCSSLKAPASTCTKLVQTALHYKSSNNKWIFWEISDNTELKLGQQHSPCSCSPNKESKRNSKKQKL